jgi:hypothetical protein
MSTFLKNKMMKAVASIMLSMPAVVLAQSTNSTTLEGSLPQASGPAFGVPVSVNFSTAYKTNMDGIQKGNLNPYDTVTMYNFGLGTQIENELSSNWKFSYNPNADVAFMDDKVYVDSNDRVRSLNFNNRFNLSYQFNESFSAGPFAVASYNSRYQMYGDDAVTSWKRDRTMFNYGAGIASALKVNNFWQVSTELSAMKNDNRGGNYRNPDEASLLHKGRNDSRENYTASLNNDFSINENVAISVPTTYSYLDYDNRLARKGSVDRFAFTPTETFALSIFDITPTLTLKSGPISLSASYTQHYERQAALDVSAYNYDTIVYATALNYSVDKFVASVGYSYQLDEYKDVYSMDLDGIPGEEIGIYQERVHKANGQVTFKKIMDSQVDATLSHERESQRWYDRSEFKTYSTSLALSVAI